MKMIALSMTLLLLCSPAMANVEINQASQADLERLRGLGPQLSTRILTARDIRPFADWEDLRSRVAGLGAVQAARLSREGLTVAGAAFAATDSMMTPRQRGASSGRGG